MLAQDRHYEFGPRLSATMGTSTSQRSPATPAWDRVRQLYRQPNPEPGEVVGRIVAALDPETRAQMHGRGVVPSLDALLWGSHRVSHAGLAPLLGEAGPPVCPRSSPWPPRCATRCSAI